ncbi:type II CAAX endopeptidase family protein [Gemmiger formicilis]|uniref:CPBP family intramembrane glutamic endopeptidase n=1 Tax=Gemmiger formicilis TaxID=745368 RepID=UPI00241C7128|nr:type II CAAX endopeptidase family protein [Gemmiger formicilis]
MTKSRGVRGAAGGCAVASLVYLLARGLLTLLVSALMGLAHPGASLAKPLGFSGVSTALFQLLIGLGAIVLTLVFLLKVTRLKTKDLRIMLPAPWSPGFCLPVFLGVANLANLAGALINRLTGSPATSEMLPSGGPELLVQFLALCVMPAIAEELLFRGAFQGLMRPCGSAAAIFAPALLFGVLHLDLAQGLTAFACGVFLGWLAERSGSILPGMLLHLVNNALAFLTIYLRYYAPAEVSFGVELFILLFFPAFGAWMIGNARRQGFSFSAGLRPGVDVLTVFTSPVYCTTVLFLVAYAAIFVH